MKTLKYIVTVIVLVTVLWKSTNIFFEYKRENNLAQLLKVNVRDYPRGSPFPINYFSDVLKPGTTITKVHRIVIGYKKVFTCQNKHSELYYYYSNDEANALRIMIVYDFNRRFIKLVEDDNNSSSIYTDDCTPGLLDE